MQIKTIIMLLVILLIAFYTFHTSFVTSIYGDELKTIWVGESAVNKTGNILNVSATEQSYLFATIVYNIFYNAIGLDGSYYYILSFLTRFIATITFFWFLEKRGLKKTSAFIGALIFMVTPIGIETTGWAKNFDSYLGISIFLLILNVCLELKNKRDSIKIILLTQLVIVINTIRSHGVLITTLGLLCFLAYFKAKQRRLLLVTAFLLLILYLFTAQLPIFGGQSGNLFVNFDLSDFVYSFFGNIGNTILPNVNSNLLSFSRSFYLGFIFFVGTTFFLLRQIHKKSTSINHLIFISYLLSFSFMIMPLVRIPQIHADSEHRYLIYSALSVPIVISAVFEKVIYSKLKYQFKYLLFSLTLFLIIVFIIQSRFYLELQNWAHGEEHFTNIWTQITNQINSNEVKKSFSFIILTDPESYPIVNSTVSFGSDYHIGLLYNIWEEENLPEVWISQSLEFNRSNLPEILFAEERTPLIFKIYKTNVERISPIL